MFNSCLSSGDGVRVYDGGDVHSPVIAHLCGVTQHVEVWSSSSSLLVEFYSAEGNGGANGTLALEGFEARYNFLVPVDSTGEYEEEEEEEEEEQEQEEEFNSSLNQLTPATMTTLAATTWSTTTVKTTTKPFVTTPTTSKAPLTTTTRRRTTPREFLSKLINFILNKKENLFI